jgi:hypothetical protein
VARLATALGSFDASRLLARNRLAFRQADCWCSGRLGAATARSLRLHRAGRPEGAVEGGGKRAFRRSEYDKEAEVSPAAAGPSEPAIAVQQRWTWPTDAFRLVAIVRRRRYDRRKHTRDGGGRTARSVAWRASCGADRRGCVRASVRISLCSPRWPRARLARRAVLSVVINGGLSRGVVTEGGS